LVELHLRSQPSDTCNKIEIHEAEFTRTYQSPSVALRSVRYMHACLRGDQRQRVRLIICMFIWCVHQGKREGFRTLSHDFENLHNSFLYFRSRSFAASSKRHNITHQLNVKTENSFLAAEIFLPAAFMSSRSSRVRCRVLLNYFQLLIQEVVSIALDCSVYRLAKNGELSVSPPETALYTIVHVRYGSSVVVNGASCIPGIYGHNCIFEGFLVRAGLRSPDSSVSTVFTVTHRLE
jgi:hypothetical protein